MESFMNRGFNVVSKELTLPSSLLIEASAGTGKTFAIEHLYQRLVLEGRSRILTVTFTKAATSELKERIRNLLETTIIALEGKGELPPYLQDLSEEELIEVRRKITMQLASFDERFITTIHGFCAEMLSLDALATNTSLQIDPEEDEKRIRSSLKDFLRSQATSPLSPLQFEKLIKAYGRSIEALQTALLPLVSSGAPLIQPVDLPQLGLLLNREIDKMRNSWSFGEALDAVRTFRGVTNRQGEIKPSIQTLLKRLWDGERDLPLDLFAKWKESSLRKGEPLPPLPFASIYQLYTTWTNPSLLLLFLAEKARAYLQERNSHQSYLGFDQLLSLMNKMVKEPSFQKRVLDEFDAALIDEFQDTDPIQWSIFKHLFLGQKPLYLVGDPKQAIYRFRQADIYTYLRAKEEIEQVVSLTTNYRATKSLVEALNTLCTSIPDFFPLPKFNKALDCPPVQPSEDAEQGDDALFLMRAQSAESLIDEAHEIVLNLHEKEQLPWSQFAILVKDRHQAEAVRSNAPFPTCSNRKAPLIESKAYPLWLDLLELIEEPRNRSAIRRFFLGQLFNLPPSDFAKKESDLIKKVTNWRQSFLDRGAAALLEALFSERSCLKRILESPEGETLFDDFRQLASAGVESNLPPLDLFAFYQTLPESIERQEVHHDAVTVTTIHMSKGLEWDVVLPIGLALPHPLPKGVVASSNGFESLDMCPDRLGEWICELDAEKMRQLYVAITRAKKRLYLPRPLEKAKTQREKTSPIQLFVDRLQIPLERFAPLTSIQASARRALEIVSPEFKKTLPPLAWQESSLLSFSSMHTSSPPPLNIESNEPRGPLVGTLLHRFLQERERRPSLLGTPLEGHESWTYKILDAAWELKIEGIRLGDLSPSVSTHELEFLYQEGENLITGAIDFLFEHDQKIYLIDWKSNSLPAYTVEEMQKAMRDHDYFLQALLYKKAITKWLEGSEKQLGGCYYIFLRGLNSVNEEGILSV